MKAIIINAARGVQRLDADQSYPLVLEKLPGRGDLTALSWMLSALEEVGISDFVLVGGYHIEKIISAHPNIRYYFDSNWQEATPFSSLALASEELQGRCLMTTGRVIFRASALEMLLEASAEADLVRAFGPQKPSSKLWEAGAVSQPVPEPEGPGIELGLWLLSPRGAERLRQACRDRDLDRSGPAGDMASLARRMEQEGLKLSDVRLGNGWAWLDSGNSLARFVFGTKAQTLERLQPHLSRATILSQTCFTEAQWRKSRDTLLKEIRDTFGRIPLVVRSSALSEDSWRSSYAGFFHSELNVPSWDQERLGEAIDRVVSSYGRARGEPQKDQVLIQPHLTGSCRSGVMFTRDPDTGAPYYVINLAYGDGDTTSVTAGAGGRVSTIVVNKLPLRMPADFSARHLVEVAQEVETLTNWDSIDLEFAEDDQGKCYLFQARPLVSFDKGGSVADQDIKVELDQIRNFVQSQMRARPGLWGESTVLGNMPDWNPAEMIGTKPRPLASSLYQYLITDSVWAESRVETGYRDVRPHQLMISLASQPYIDARVDFNSFLPASLGPKLSQRLVEHYLDRLRQNPHMQDKIEFEIAFTCLAFDFSQQAGRLSDAGWTASELAELRSCLGEITAGLLSNYREIQARELQRLRTLGKRRLEYLGRLEQDDPAHLPFWVRTLLEDCKRFGTLPFSNLARHAFVGNALLRSLVARGVISPQEQDRFLASIPTVASTISAEMARLAAGDGDREAFLKHYGHLRPGTYDILSPRYDEEPENYLPECSLGGYLPNEGRLPESGDWRHFFSGKAKAISALAIEAGLDLPPEDIVAFVVTSLQLREQAKFDFSKNVSEALRLLGIYGRQLDMKRDDLSFVSIQHILALAANSPSAIVKREIERESGRGRKRYGLTRAIKLPPVIRNLDEVDAFELKEDRPNFVTGKKVSAELVVLSPEATPAQELDGRVVLIENADPGYDWIFGRDIAGLVTKYGGMGSHMAIRAAEFGLPAVIGCGEVIFSKLQRSKRVIIDCAAQLIQVLK